MFTEEFKKMNAEVIILKGIKYAVLPFEAWEKLQEYLEELQDIADCNEIKARIEQGKGEYFPEGVVDALIDGENAIKTFREYRGLTQTELASKAGLSVAMIKKLESGETGGSIKTIKAIASALNLEVDDLI
jgi:DNA-binding XRE family transcriptional regulator